MTRSSARGMRIGIDLGGTKTSGIVLAPDGSLAAEIRSPSPRDSYPASLVALTELVAELELQAGLPPGVAPIGIGTPGAWIARAGVMKNCNSTWLNGRPLLTDLIERLGPNVRVANDADCFALSEAADGAGAGAELVFGVILGTGVGGGVVFGGHAHGGPNGLCGEWGHVPLPYLRQRAHVGLGHSSGPSGAPDPVLDALEDRLARRACYCGRYDCIETFLAGPGLAALHAELWGEVVAPTVLAIRSDEPARQTLALHRELLARSLAQVVNLLDPDVIVLGGGLSNLPGLAPALAVRMPAYLFDSRGARDGVVRVERARWGDDSGVRGAARLWRLD